MNTIEERYKQAMKAIAEIEKIEIKTEIIVYFKTVAKFLVEIKELVALIQEDKLKILPFVQLQQLNHNLYRDILPSFYKTSYANPTYATKKLGIHYGAIFAFLYTELRGLIVYAYEKRMLELTIFLELFLEIYSHFQIEQIQEVDKEKEIRQIICAFYYKHTETFLTYRVKEQLDASYNFAVKIIELSDLNDISYLYQFGEYITENEIQIANYLNKLSKEKIIGLARTFTEGFKEGFSHANIDLSKKKVVNIRYSIGFERIVKEVITQFRKIGLQPVVYRTSVNSMTKKQNLKIGYYSTSPNKQYDYDHRYDSAFYLDKDLIDRKLEVMKCVYEQQKKLAKEYAGPAVMEIFGEQMFSPIRKEEALQLDEKQQKLELQYNTESGILINQYIPSTQCSFTIISYPIPEIGSEFEAIFDETVKVNTLDKKEYEAIQQVMIDVLDEGEYVVINGVGKNRTNLTIQLYPLKDKRAETKFENCLADVNIPLGELFTSPVLNGTNGILHVSEVYLNELNYKNLELTFQDGMIVHYRCENFEKEEEGKRFIKENLLFHHNTLPMGEFAIGTNTTAYRMGKKYKISEKLPILIAEKTGPHFAIGDTCYKMSEDLIIKNPNGKEMIAKENEYSVLRKTEIEEAYFNCHTDITIPYDELGEIAVYNKNGEKKVILSNGRFVLCGTEKLNEPLDDLRVQ